jgi:hypothetical protein
MYNVEYSSMPDLMNVTFSSKIESKIIKNNKIIK